MKTLFLTTMILTISLGSNAQYFQRNFNFDVTRANYKPEVFYDGVCTRLNFDASDATKFYNVAIGFTKVSETPPSPAVVYNEVRFVRTKKDGATVSQNYGYSLAKKGSTAWLHAEAHAICEIDNGAGTGGYIAVGSVADNPETGVVVPGGRDAMIMRINSSGSVPNRLRFNFNGAADELNGVIRSQFDPGYFFACGTASFTTHSKVIVMKFNSTGTVVWAKTIHFDNFFPGTFSNFCTAKSIAEDQFTGDLFIVGGHQEPGSAAAHDGLLIKLDPAGGVLFARAYHLGTDEEFKAVKITNSGELIICGYSNVLGTFGIPWDTWLTKINTSGTVQFSNILRHTYSGTPATSKAYDVTERINSDMETEYYLAGLHIPPSGGQMSSICKTDDGGNGIAWYPYQNMYSYNDHGFGIDYANAAMSAQGLRMFTGMTDASGMYADGYMMRAYFNGATCNDYCPEEEVATTEMMPDYTPLENEPIFTYNKFSLDFLRTGFQSNLICSQTSVSCGSNEKMFSTVQSVPPETSDELTLFPNPASKSCLLRIHTSKQESVSVFLSDMYGKKIKTILNEELISAGYHEFMIKVDDLTSGIYQCVVLQNHVARSIKLVVEQ